jgi:hypothetical protein
MFQPFMSTSSSTFTSTRDALLRYSVISDLRVREENLVYEYTHSISFNVKCFFQWEFIFVRHYVRMWFTSCMIVGVF